MMERIYNSKNKERKRCPAGPGSSIGHIRTYGGTLSALVREKRTGELLILSNNHVIANCTNGCDGRARRGDPVFHPSIGDGGRYRDIIARLYKWVPLIEGAENLVDAALAKPINRNYVFSRIIGLGDIEGEAEGKRGMRVKKVGRSSGLTCGEIIEEGFKTTITLEGRSFTFADQLVIDIPCREGDSGSIVVDNNNRAVGLLFAAQGNLGIANRIQHVTGLLGIDFTKRF
ncbi:MAG: hypothetical protein QME73_03480 [Bacillota bacterium]|nr:hypothetical protein [Bacillota bacterium]